MPVTLIKTFRRTAAALALSLLATSAAHAVEAGQPAPAFSLPRQGGGTLNLSDYAGKFVYVDFWASWCGPCRESFPWMNQMLARHGSQLNIVAINVDAKSADAEKFLASVPAQFTIGFDPKGKTPEAYALKGMPTSYLVGPDGKVLLVHPSFRASEAAELEARIAQMIGAGGAP